MSVRLGPYILGPTDNPNQGIYTGDCRELAPAIPDESVDLIFTDPVYQRIDDYRWLAETAARVLKPRGSILAFCAHALTIPSGTAMLPHLDPCPILEHYLCSCPPRLFSHSIQCNVMPLLWFSKGNPDNKWMALQQADYLTGSRGHKWGKNVGMVLYRTQAFTQIDDIVVDFFCGGAAIVAGAKMLGRRWLAFEIDPDVAETARQRVRQTQPPLFTLDAPEQLEMKGI